MSNLAQPVGQAGIRVSTAAGVGGVELSDDVDRRWLGTLAGGGMTKWCATIGCGCCRDDVDFTRIRTGCTTDDEDVVTAAAAVLSIYTNSHQQLYRL